MVQTEEQYAYIHECLLRALESDLVGRVNPAFSLSDLNADSSSPYANLDAVVATTASMVPNGGVGTRNAGGSNAGPIAASASATSNVQMRHRHRQDASVAGSRPASKKLMRNSSGASSGDPRASTATATPTEASSRPATTTTTLERHAPNEAISSSENNKRISNESSGSNRSGGDAVIVPMPLTETSEQQTEQSGVVFAPRGSHSQRRGAPSQLSLSRNQRGTPEAVREAAASTPTRSPARSPHDLGTAPSTSPLRHLRSGIGAGGGELELVECVAPSGTSAGVPSVSDKSVAASDLVTAAPMRPNPPFTSFI